MEPKDVQPSLAACDALFSSRKPTSSPAKSSANVCSTAVSGGNGGAELLKDDWAEMEGDDSWDTAGHKAVGKIQCGIRIKGKFKPNSENETLGAAWICAKDGNILCVAQKNKRNKASSESGADDWSYQRFMLDDLDAANLIIVKTIESGDHPCLEIDFLEDPESETPKTKVVKLWCAMPRKKLREHVHKMVEVLRIYKAVSGKGFELSEWKVQRMPESVRALIQAAQRSKDDQLSDDEGGSGRRSRVRRRPSDMSPSDGSPQDRESKKGRKGSRSPSPRRNRRPSPTGAMKGFKNLGNTCYMSSVVSVLSLLRPFADDMLSACPEDDPPAEGSVLAAFCNIIRATRDQNRGVQDLSELREAVCRRRPHFLGHEQHDAHEFYTAFVSLLVSELRKRERKQRGAAARRSFEVPGPNTNVRLTLVAERKCTKCSHVGPKKSDSFWCWSLNVGEESECCWYEDDQYICPETGNLIENAVVREIVEYSCEQEGCSGKEAIQELFIGQMPRFLILSVNRFSLSEDGTTYSKKSTPVHVSEVLDLRHLTGKEELEGSSKKWVGIAKKPFGVDAGAKMTPFPDTGPWRLPQPEVVIDLDDDPGSGYTPGKDEDEDLQRALAASMQDSQMFECIPQGGTGGGGGEVLDIDAVAIADVAPQSVDYTNEAAKQEEAQQQVKEEERVKEEVMQVKEEEQVKEEVMEVKGEAADPVAETAPESEDEDEDEEDDEYDYPEITKAKYKLHAVVSHVGQASQSGHYLSDVRDPESGNWLRFNDSRLVTGGYTKKTLKEYWKKNAYLLVYSHVSECYKVR